VARPSYNQLYYFHVVASERSLSGAAERLGLSQSTLSEHVRKLEHTLDTPLFDRTGRRLRLNDPGRRVYEHTQAMFRIGERLFARFVGRDHGERILVKVGVASTVSRRTAGTRFQPLLRRLDILVHVRHADHAHLMEQLAAYELDLVLSDMPPTNGGRQALAARELETSELVAVGTPTLLDESDERRFPELLDGLRHVAHPKQSRLGWEVDDWMTVRGLSPDVVAEVDDVAMMLLAAEEGAGFAVVPRKEARSAIERGTLTELGVLDETQATVYAVYHERSTSEIVMELVESLGAADAD